MGRKGSCHLCKYRNGRVVDLRGHDEHWIASLDRMDIRRMNMNEGITITDTGATITGNMVQCKYRLPCRYCELKKEICTADNPITITPTWTTPLTNPTLTPLITPAPLTVPTPLATPIEITCSIERKKE